MGGDVINSISPPNSCSAGEQVPGGSEAAERREQQDGQQGGCRVGKALERDDESKVNCDYQFSLFAK